MTLDEILSKIDARYLYNTYFIRDHKPPLEKILTSQEEVLNTFNDWVSLETYMYNITNIVFDNCQRKISKQLIKDIFLDRNPNSILLFPCLRPCENIYDLYGFLYATVQPYEKTMYLSLICSNGSFLMMLIIFIAKYLNINFIFLQSTPEYVNFYKKYGFEMKNYKGDQNFEQYKDMLRFAKGDELLEPMFLDLSKYGDEQLEALETRSW
jgi:hypothetical protein